MGHEYMEHMLTTQKTFTKYHRETNTLTAYNVLEI